MGLVTVLAPASVDSLTSVQALREVLGTTSTANETAQANTLKRATAWAESYVGRPLRLQTYSEVVAGYGDFYLLLTHRPIRRVVRVFSGTDTGTATEYTSTEYSIDPGTGRLYRPAGYPWTVTRGRPPSGGFALDPVEVQPIPFGEMQSFLVEYSAGYVGEDGTTSTGDGSTSTGRTLPHDIEAAILAKAGEWVKFGAYGGPQVTNKSVGDLSIGYSSPGSGSGGGAGMGMAESMLAQYRSI